MISEDGLDYSEPPTLTEKLLYLLLQVVIRTHDYEEMQDIKDKINKLAEEYKL